MYPTGAVYIPVVSTVAFLIDGLEDVTTNYQDIIDTTAVAHTCIVIIVETAAGTSATIATIRIVILNQEKKIKKPTKCQLLMKTQTQMMRY